MDLSTRPVRTYSRRQSTKNAAGSAPSSPDRSGRFTPASRVSDEEERPRKRRTIINSGTDTDEQENPHSALKTYLIASRPNSRNRNRSPEVPTAPSSSGHKSSLEEGRSQPDKEKGMVANDRPLDTTDFPAILRGASPSANETSTSRPTTPKKPKDLSRIFDSVSPQRRTHSLGNFSPSSPGKSSITKKMLSRARTEGSIESSPSKEVPQLTPKARPFVVPREPHPSHQEVVSPSCSPKKPLSRNPSLTSLASGAQHSQRDTTSSTRTYAGKSRSFLVALPAAALLTRNGQSGMKQNTLDDDDEEYLRDSYAELRERYGVDNSEGIDAETGDAGSVGEGLSLYNPLFSITDLRSKGESRRFRDEVGYLFEGLEPNGALSVRRSSGFDIVSKLSDQDFWRKTRAAGLIIEIWDRLRQAGAGNGDKVLDPILCCFVALASEDPRDISLLATKEDFVETIVQLMVTHSTNDPLVSSSSSTQLKLSKGETLTLRRLRDLMSTKTDIVSEQCQPSTRLLLSCSLASVPTLAFTHLAAILDNVSGDLVSVCNRLAAYKTGLSLFTGTAGSTPSHEKLCLEHIYNCLTILDSYLIEVEALGTTPNLSKAELRQRYRTLPSGLVALIVIADIINRDDLLEALRFQANRCSELAFRILINLTNGDPTWTDAVTADPYTLPTTIRLVMSSHRSLLSSSTKKLSADEPQDASTSAMDRLCLALALLTNLLQERDNLAFSLQNIMFDPACQGQRSCLLGCRCSNSVSAISGLVNMYISFLKDEGEDSAPDLHFLRGHLSVLVGLILLQLHSPGLPTSQSPTSSPFPSQFSSLSSSTTSPVQSIIDSLPGPSDSLGRIQKLDALIENVDAFSRLYASLTSRVGGTRNGHPDGLSSGRERDEDEIDVENENDDTAQRPSRNACDSDIVAGVTASLRTLRDDLCRS